jgi:hypothetical protein
MALDLGDVIGSMISIAVDTDTPTKAQSLDTLATLPIARNTLEDAIREADRAAKGGAR